MDNFNFLDLPLVVQEIIVEKLVKTLSVNDWLAFSMTSEYCLWLIRRVIPRKVVNCAIISCSSTNVSFYLEGKNFSFDYSNESANDLGRLLSFVQFRILRIDRKLFDPKNVEFFEKFENSWAASVKNVKKLHIPSITDYEEEFLKFLSLIETLEELEIHETIDEQEVVLQILSKMKNVRSLYLIGPMNDDFLKLLASKTSPEKPLIKCFINAKTATFTNDATEKFKQDVYCDEKDKIRFQNYFDSAMLTYN